MKRLRSDCIESCERNVAVLDAPAGNIGCLLKLLVIGIVNVPPFVFRRQLFQTAFAIAAKAPARQENFRLSDKASVRI
jgi:hypothetical protein